MYRVSLLLALAIHFLTSSLAWGQTTPSIPIPPVMCASYYLDRYHTDNPVIFLRNDCSETIVWAACLTDNDMSSNEFYDGILEPGYEVYFDTTTSSHLGTTLEFTVIVNWMGQELPPFEC